MKQTQKYMQNLNGIVNK